MTVSRSLLVRAIAYGLVMLYLTVDFFIVRGPLSRRLESMARGGAVQGFADPQATAGKVFGRAIAVRALDQQIILDAARGGRAVDLGALDPRTRTDFRLAAMDALMSAICLDAKLTVRQELFDDAATDQAMRQAEVRAGGGHALDSQLAAAGMDRPAMRESLRAEIARHRYLEERIAASGANQASDQEIDDWLAAHPDLPGLPARVKLRHIFKASLRQDPATLDAAMQAMHGELIQGVREFAALAAAESEDPSSGARGGDLGWVELSADRLPEGIDPAVLAAAPIGQPLAPVSSALGRHIFLIDAKEPARPASPEEMRGEVRAHLVSAKRRAATRLILDALKTEGEAVIHRQIIESAPPAL